MTRNSNNSAIKNESDVDNASLSVSAASRPRPRPPVWHEAGRQQQQQQQQQIAFATSSSLIVASQQADSVVGNMLPVAPQFAASANKFSFQLKKKLLKHLKSGCSLCSCCHSCCPSLLHVVVAVALHNFSFVEPLRFVVVAIVVVVFVAEINL